MSNDSELAMTAPPSRQQRAWRRLRLPQLALAALSLGLFGGLGWMLISRQWSVYRFDMKPSELFAPGFRGGAKLPWSSLAPLAVAVLLFWHALFDGKNRLALVAFVMLGLMMFDLVDCWALR